MLVWRWVHQEYMCEPKDIPQNNAVHTLMPISQTSPRTAMRAAMNDTVAHRMHVHSRQFSQLFGPRNEPIPATVGSIILWISTLTATLEQLPSEVYMYAQNSQQSTALALL